MMIALNQQKLPQKLPQKPLQTLTHSSAEEENLLIHQYTNLVIKIARQFDPPDAEILDEYIQIGRIGLLKAIRKYDKRRYKTKLITFAWRCIRNELVSHVIKENRYKTRYQPTDVIEKISAIKQDLSEILPKSISDVEHKVIMLRAKGATYKEIGLAINKTKDQANTICKKAIRKIRAENI